MDMKEPINIYAISAAQVSRFTKFHVKCPSNAALLCKKDSYAYVCFQAIYFQNKYKL